jgi:hypothetical protein
MFSDADIANHMRSITVPNGRRVSMSSGSSVANYAGIGIPDEKDRTVGKTPHRAAFQAKNEAKFTLAQTRDRAQGSLMQPMRWAKASDAE